MQHAVEFVTKKSRGEWWLLRKEFLRLLKLKPRALNLIEMMSTVSRVFLDSNILIFIF